jgi:hypothetical protein
MFNDAMTVSSIGWKLRWKSGVISDFIGWADLRRRWISSLMKEAEDGRKSILFYFSMKDPGKLILHNPYPARDSESALSIFTVRFR